MREYHFTTTADVDWKSELALCELNNTLSYFVIIIYLISKTYALHEKRLKARTTLKIHTTTREKCKFLYFMYHRILFDTALGKT